MRIETEARFACSHPNVPVHRVAIIGGGFAGASLARSLTLAARVEPGDIVVFEPRQRLGAGLAYDACDPAMRLNVAAHRMRAQPEAPDAFLSFLRQSDRLARDPDAIRGTDVYARRADFAAFMEETMRPLLDDGTVIHARDRVDSVHRSAEGWQIVTEHGARHFADAIVIATGHPAAAIPAPLADFARNDNLISTHPARLTDIGQHDRILIVGAGLTALDYIAALDRIGHRGRITLLSRTGLLPASQSSVPTEPYGDFLTLPAITARGLLATVKSTINRAETEGRSWHWVFDALRKQGQDIWQALPEAEQDRFLRHLRRRYEVSRFRMPPQHAELLAKLHAQGRVETLAGHIEQASERHGGIKTSLRPRKGGPLLHQDFDRIMIATGPDGATLFRVQPWLKALASEGLVTPARRGLGIVCDRECRALGLSGTASEDIFVLGPPTRGTFGEITGAPEIAAQAAAIAGRLGATILETRPTHDLLHLRASSRRGTATIALS